MALGSLFASPTRVSNLTTINSTSCRRNRRRERRRRIHRCEVPHQQRPEGYPRAIRKPARPRQERYADTFALCCTLLTRSQHKAAANLSGTNSKPKSSASPPTNKPSGLAPAATPGPKHTPTRAAMRSTSCRRACGPASSSPCT
jgi:hypothetical protein